MAAGFTSQESAEGIAVGNAAGIGSSTKAGSGLQASRHAFLIRRKR